MTTSTSNQDFTQQASEQTTTNQASESQANKTLNPADLIQQQDRLQELNKRLNDLTSELEDKIELVKNATSQGDFQIANAVAGYIKAGDKYACLTDSQPEEVLNKLEEERVSLKAKLEQFKECQLSKEQQKTLDSYKSSLAACLKRINQAKQLNRKYSTALQDFYAKSTQFKQTPKANHIFKISNYNPFQALGIGISGCLLFTFIFYCLFTWLLPFLRDIGIAEPEPKTFSGIDFLTASATCATGVIALIGVILALLQTYFNTKTNAITEMTGKLAEQSHSVVKQNRLLINAIRHEGFTKTSCKETLRSIVTTKSELECSLLVVKCIVSQHINTLKSSKQLYLTLILLQHTINLTYKSLQHCYDKETYSVLEKILSIFELIDQLTTQDVNAKLLAIYNNSDDIRQKFNDNHNEPFREFVGRFKNDRNRLAQAIYFSGIQIISKSNISSILESSLSCLKFSEEIHTIFERFDLSNQDKYNELYKSLTEFNKLLDSYSAKITPDRSCADFKKDENKSSLEIIEALFSLQKQILELLAKS